MNTRVKKNDKINKDLIKERKKEKIKKRKRKLKNMFVILILLLGLFLIYSRYIEPNMLIVHENKIISSDLPKSFDGTNLVHFSDLHYGSTINKDNINKVIDKINILKPDIVVFTGDLFFDSYKLSNEDINILSDAFNNIDSKLGKYIIYGNHDYYRDEFLEVINKTDFIVLVNDYDIIYNNSNEPILIYGTDDLLFGSPNLNKLNDDEINNINYKIVLTHECDYIDEVLNYDINLILSGHSHNGQINIPYLINLYLPDGCKKYYKPYYKIDNKDIYISNGVGTSLLKLRFRSIPSINLYRLTKGN